MDWETAYRSKDKLLSDEDYGNQWGVLCIAFTIVRNKYILEEIAASFTANQQQICIEKVDFTALTTKSMLSTNTAETLPVIFLFHMFQFLKYEFRGVAQKFPLPSPSGTSLASSGFAGEQEGWQSQLSTLIEGSSLMRTA